MKESYTYFRARATGPQDVTFGRSSNGNDQIAVVFEITEGDRAGQRMTWTGTFTEKATAITMRALRAAGWATDDLTDMSGIGDKDVDLAVGVEEYEGEVRERIRWVNEPGGGKFAFKQPVEGHDLKALAARVKGEAVASRLPAGTTHAAPAAGGAKPAAARPAQKPSGAARAASAKGAASLMGDAQPVADFEEPPF